ncbi:type VII secretion protein EssA [Listeria newyorkensis]|nr:type VII secretion protein EssA [Listeria newyorkensis]
MRKMHRLSLILIIFLLPLQVSADSGTNDGSLHLDASRMENANDANETKDDLYIKYNIELFNNAGNAQAEQNIQTQTTSDKTMHQELFLAQHGTTSNRMDVAQLFTSNQTTTTTKVETETFDTAYLMYGIIIIIILVILFILIRATIKELRTNKTK